MALDLIPPASPAGRPAPDGTPNLIELPPEPPRSAAQPSQLPNLGPSKFRNRFGFLMGALAGVFVAAALILVIVVHQNSQDPAGEGVAKNWSKWHPTTDSLDDGAKQIAEKVGAEYKHPNGKQLLLVQGSEFPPDLHVALQPSSGTIRTFDGPGVVYQLNGLGANSSIVGGTPSEKRLQVVQREGLELALYTFRYLPDTEMVLVTLPPPPPDTDTAATCATEPVTTTKPECVKTALFYRPGDLKQQLQVPLGVTVPAKAPTPDTLDPTEAKNIDALTLSNKFVWMVQQDTGFLVLRRP